MPRAASSTEFHWTSGGRYGSETEKSRLKYTWAVYSTPLPPRRTVLPLSSRVQAKPARGPKLKCSGSYGLSSGLSEPKSNFRMSVGGFRLSNPDWPLPIGQPPLGSNLIVG